MPKRGANNPYKGVPKSQWAAIKAGMAANPNSAQAQEGEPMREMLPDATGNDPRETITPAAATVGSGGSGGGGSTPYAGVSTLTLNAAGADAIPQNLFDGNTPKLLLYSKSGDPKDPVPGYRTYWFNDDGNRLTLAKASGWEHIDRDEVMMGVELGPSNKDLGSKVRYVVGTLRSGDPMYAYAMKLPLYIAEAHAAQRQAVNDRVAAALRNATHVQTGENLIPGGQPGWNAPPISIAAKTYR